MNMKNSFSNFLKTKDEEQIFFSTNFPHTEAPDRVLVFNYGLVCSNTHWSKQLGHFDKLGYKILIHDYRGHFQSSGKDNISQITFEKITEDLHQLITKLKIKKSILIGHSMGVNICLEYAHRYPKDVEKMVLISGTIVPLHNIMLNTNITGTLKPKLKSVLEKFPTIFNKAWKYSGWNPVMRKLVHYGGFNVDQVDNEFIEIYMNKLGSLGPDIFMQLIDQMQEHNTLSFVQSIKIPTLIIGGNRDKVIPNFLQRLMNENMEKSELYILQKGSHVPQADFPEFLNERVHFFLEKN